MGTFSPSPYSFRPSLPHNVTIWDLSTTPCSWFSPGHFPAPQHRQAAKGSLCWLRPLPGTHIPCDSMPGFLQSCTGHLQTEEENKLKPGAKSMLTARGLVQKKTPRDCALLVIPGPISQGTCPGLGKRGNTSVGQKKNKGRWFVPVLYLHSSDNSAQGQAPGDTAERHSLQRRGTGECCYTGGRSTPERGCTHSMSLELHRQLLPP